MQATTDPAEAAPLTRLAAVSSSRRGFLAGVAALGAVLVAGACGSDDDSGSGAGTTAGGSENGNTTTTAEAGGDLAVATLAAGLEKLAVDTYQAAGTAAGAGKLGAVPPAVGEFVTTAMGHHQAALDAWNKVLKGAGKPEVAAPNATLKPTVDAEFAKVKDVGGAARLALMLEDIAAATYLSAIPTLRDKAAIQQAGAIQAIDMQHAAVLRYVLGEYPVPDTFAKTTGAATR